MMLVKIIKRGINNIKGSSIEIDAVFFAVSPLKIIMNSNIIIKMIVPGTIIIRNFE